MTRVRTASGGGRTVEVSADRIPGWVNRFGVRNAGVIEVRATPDGVHLRAGNGTTAELVAPFGPVSQAGGEPLEALLQHIAGIGDVAVILIRGGAYSIGLARGGEVRASSTDARYLQSRTAAGGWSQQRYQRRRGNQRRDAARAAAGTARRVLESSSSSLVALVTGGESSALAAVLDEGQLRFLHALPRRHFADIAEPRRAVLDAVAARALTVVVTVRDGDATSRT